jgi:tripartite-type tricarboxylate transporter receptor subunit TctC
MRKTLALAGILVLNAAFGLSLAAAQDFPKKQPVKIIVAVPAGGLTDALARVTAEFLQRRIGQAVVVENRPGASSTIGADFVAKAPADGYTLLLAGAEQPVVAAVRSSIPYKLEDFTYLMRPFTTQPLLLVGPNSPFKSTEELVAHMKANPGRLKYGTTGVGAIAHVEAAAGVKGAHITHTGIAPVFQDMLAGTIDFVVGGTPPIPDGLKVIGTVGTRRTAAFPNAPTLEESGVKGATWDLWFGFLAPPSTPKPVADYLIKELDALYKDPEVIAKVQQVGKVVPEINPLVGDAFRAQVITERGNWKAVADREKIVVQQ